MNKTNLMIASLLIVFGLIVVFFVIPAQVGESEDYDLSPSFMPMVATVSGTLMMVLLFLSSLIRRKKAQDEPSPMTLNNWAYFGIVVLILLLSLLVVNYLGFLIGGALTVAAFMLTMKVRNPIHLGLVSIATPVALWLVFWKLLKIPLP